MQQFSLSSSSSPSLTTLLQRRAEGRYGSSPYKFSYSIARKRSRRLLERHLYPRLHNPTPKSTVLSLDACKDGRYLLTGNKQGILCIYDLSPWGSCRSSNHPNDENRCNKQDDDDAWRMDGDSKTRERTTTHHPVQQAATAQRFIVSCQWYPVDTGMFFSASRSGMVQCWDTNAMVPLSEIQPFRFVSDSSKRGGSLSSRRYGVVGSRGGRASTTTTTTTTLSCMQVSPSDGLTLAVGSSTCGDIKLVDVRSGSSSHTLTGHGRGGVADLAWSPACPFVLASGGSDGCILLWDIRRAGSLLGFITACDMEESQRRVPNEVTSNAYQADYAHLRSQKLRRHTTSAAKMPLAHVGGCVGLEFSPNGHYLVSAGGNGDLTVWDLHHKGAAYPIPRRFASAAANGSGGGGAAKPIDSGQYHGRLMMGRVPLVLEQHGDGESTRIWTRHGAHLYAYSMHRGGSPEIVLKGHMGHVAAIAPIGNAGQLVSSANDGLLLLWGPTGWSSRSESVVRSRSGKRRQVLRDQDDW